MPTVDGQQFSYTPAGRRAAAAARKAKGNPGASVPRPRPMGSRPAPGRAPSRGVPPVATPARAPRPRSRPAGRGTPRTPMTPRTPISPGLRDRQMRDREMNEQRQNEQRQVEQARDLAEQERDEGSRGGLGGRGRRRRPKGYNFTRNLGGIPGKLGY